MAPITELQSEITTWRRRVAFKSSVSLSSASAPLFLKAFPSPSAPSRLGAARLPAPLYFLFKIWSVQSGERKRGVRAIVPPIINSSSPFSLVRKKKDSCDRRLRRSTAAGEKTNKRFFRNCGGVEGDLDRSGDQMKAALRIKTEKSPAEIFPNSPRKDCSISLIKAVAALVIFTSGVLIGFSATSHFSQYKTQPEFFAPAVCTKMKGKDQGSLKNHLKTKTLKHNMSDDELFWKASMVPQRNNYPYRRVPKLAFLFLTRKDLPLAPLWERFLRGHKGKYSIYVHSHPNYKLNVSASSPFYRREIPSQVVSWGSISLLDAEKRLLANALLDFSNERFVLLSESCIPIFSFPVVYKYLIESNQSFVESYDDPSPRGRGRYNRRMAPMIRLPQWRKGSEWFEVNRQLAVIIVADVIYHEIFAQYCRPSCYPDEHYIPTYLHMFHGALNSNRTITWVDWSMGGPHPVEFGSRRATAHLIESIRNNGTICTHNSEPTSVCFLFARKFAASSLGALLNISSTVMKF